MMRKLLCRAAVRLGWMHSPSRCLMGTCPRCRKHPHQTLTDSPQVHVTDEGK